MARGSVQQMIEQLLKQTSRVSTREVAIGAGVSRQAAQKQLKALVRAGRLAVEGRARAARYRLEVDDSARPVDVPPESSTAPRRVLRHVAETGSLFRLSARLLLSELTADELVLDFTGVMDVGEEFLEEVFTCFPQANPGVQLAIVNLPPGVRARVRDYARSRCRLTILPSLPPPPRSAGVAPAFS